MSQFQLAAIPETKIPLKEIFDRIQSNEEGDSIEKKKNDIETILKNTLAAEYKGKENELISDTLDALLAVNAELEHTLMIQYLFAAYSIKLDADVSADSAISNEDLVNWQMQLLGVAREEMGHLMIVQNIRKSLGFELHFEMNQLVDYLDLFPYTLKLHRLSLETLASYIYAESPLGWFNDEKHHDAIDKKILEYVAQKIEASSSSEALKLFKNRKSTSSAAEIIGTVASQGINVAGLFTIIIFFIEHFMEEHHFSVASVYQQAKADQWNRGYVATERKITIDTTEKSIPSSKVLVHHLLSKWECLEAIKDVAEQGENTSDLNDPNTHFCRFKTIFKQLLTVNLNLVIKDIASQPAVPSNVPKKTHTPRILQTLSAIAAGKPSDISEKVSVASTKITHKTTLHWAEIANIHYTLLLTFVGHSFHIEPNHQNASESLRGLIINSSFTEMYNLKALSEILTTLPVATEKGQRAGLPFQILNIDSNLNFIAKETFLLEKSNKHIDLLLQDSNLLEQQKKYLKKLRSLNVDLLQKLH